MWRDVFIFSFASIGTTRFVLAHYNNYVYLPTVPRPFDTRTVGEAFEYMKRVNGPGPGISRIEGLTSEQVDQARSWGHPVRPTLTEYLYDRSNLAGLHGDPYRAKRADINHLLKEHSVLFRPYRASDLKACGDLFELWKNQRLPGLKGQMGEKMILSSQKAHFRALLEGESMGMDIWVVLLKDRIAAYSAGVPLNPETYGVFLEVTDLTVKGLSAYIFTNLCRMIGSFPRINTGDAEGLPRLAESKEHWHPAERLTIFAIDPKP